MCPLACALWRQPDNLTRRYRRWFIHAWTAHTCQPVCIIQRCAVPAQWHDEHHEESGHGDEEDRVQTITKEMDMAHLEHAGFDPEAAAFEDGNDVEDLGYDEEIEPGLAFVLTVVCMMAWCRV